MGLPQLETCCCVFDLKSGNLIIGCLNAMFSFILMIIMIVVVCTLQPIENVINGETDWNAEAAFTGLYVMSIILVLMFLAKFCFDLLYIYGIVNERRDIIRNYLVMWTVFFLLSMFTFFLNAPHYNAGTICTEVFYIGLNVYVFLLCYSFYRLLNTREEV